jgi:ABC-type transport system involved in multi-copper enzyme maturation permease subunit
MTNDIQSEVHLEVYRRFEGKLLEHPLRPVVLARSAIRQGFKSKQAALLLFVPPALIAIVRCVMLHLSYQAQIDAAEAGGMAALQGKALADMLGGVTANIASFLDLVATFAILAMTWYGAGMIAEDKRHNANLLYFSRPLSRLEYMCGKLLGVALFGACVLLVPCLMILAVASFSSPDWSFIKDQWHVIPMALGYCCAWILVVASLVLGVSSQVSRKTTAVALVLGLIFVLSIVSAGVAEGLDQPNFGLLNIYLNFKRVAASVFDIAIDPRSPYPWDVWASVAVLGGVLIGSLALLTRSV